MREFTFLIPNNKREVDYVGFDSKRSNSSFVFPCQYFGNDGRFPRFVTRKDKEFFAECKREAKRLIYVISKCRAELEQGQQEGYFPYLTYTKIIEDFLSRGYYHQTSQISSAGGSGKTDWKKTISHSDIWFNNGNLVYKQFFKFKRKIEDNEIITQIYKCCLKIAVDKIGWLYDIESVERSIFDAENKSHLAFMIDFLKQELSNSFLDYKKQLLALMLSILEAKNEGAWEACCYANDSEFEYVFERMINSALGSENVRDFYSSAQYHFDNETVMASKLRPDTITMFSKEQIEKVDALQQFGELKEICFVLDAKYYNYGYTKLKARDLPNSSSITKQIGYAQFIEQHELRGRDSYIITSVFMLPYSGSQDLKYVCYADYAFSGDNKIRPSKGNLNPEAANKVYVCLVNLKKLVELFYSSNKTGKSRMQQHLLGIISEKL